MSRFDEPPRVAIICPSCKNRATMVAHGAERLCRLCGTVMVPYTPLPLPGVEKPFIERLKRAWAELVK